MMTKKKNLSAKGFFSALQSIGVLLIFILTVGYGGSAEAQPGPLMAGTAKINITPQSEEPVHDSVYARTLVLEVSGQRIAFVSVDLVIFTSDHLEKICHEQLGISRLILCSSHNHAAPLYKNQFSYRQDSPFQPFYENQILKALKSSLAGMFPAKIAAAKKKFPQLGFNRLIVRADGKAKESWLGDAHYNPENPERIPFGPVDNEVDILKITDLQDSTRVVMMNYAMHADVVCFNYAISADYPGAAANKVEESLGKNVNCLFVQGAGGNIESLMISPRRSGPDDTVQTDYRPMYRTGELLAWPVVELVRDTHMPDNSEESLQIASDTLHFTGRYDSSRKFNVQILTLLINKNIAIAVCPGEMFIQFQLNWKESMNQDNAIGLFFGYSWSGGDWPGYIADVRSAALGGYGADGGNLIEVGAGEQIMTEHLQNYYQLTGLLSKEAK